MNDAFGHPQSIVVLGGTSDIARQIVRSVVPPGCRSVVLAGRDPDRLASAAVEAERAGARAAPIVLFDALEPAGAARTIEECFALAAGDVDLVVVAVGVLGDQEIDEVEPSATSAVLTANFTWPAAALAAAAGPLRRQGQGRIVVLSSVAGVRVRRANYVYGASKAGLDGYALGLAEALRGSGVRVQVVRPGFVRTKMTRGRSGAPFAVGADRVGAAVARGLQTNEPIIWVPKLLRWVFLVMRNLPDAAWRRIPG
ncbi:MAG: SDR family NAD(P)-dependent oxidoreductase [Acidimicrobiales bacterium]